jgi:hypothetical protein
MNSSTNYRNTNNNIDVFDISALIQDKPYQLSKFHRHQQATLQNGQSHAMDSLQNINLADLVDNMYLNQEEQETRSNKSCPTNVNGNQHTLISTNNLTFQLGPTNSVDANHQANLQQQQMEKSSLITKKKMRRQRTLFKSKQLSKNEPSQQVVDADLTDLIHVNNLASKLKSSDQI